MKTTGHVDDQRMRGQPERPVDLDRPERERDHRRDRDDPSLRVALIAGTLVCAACTAISRTSPSTPTTSPASRASTSELFGWSSRIPTQRSSVRQVAGGRSARCRVGGRCWTSRPTEPEVTFAVDDLGVALAAVEAGGGVS